MKGTVSKSKRNMICAVILAAEILIVSIIFAYAASLRGSDKTIPVDINRFKSEYASIGPDGRSWTITPDQVPEGATDDHIYFLRGPYTDLAKGDYRVTVYYSADSLNYVKAHSDKNNGALLSEYERLESYNKRVTFDLRAKENINDLEFVFLYFEKGIMTVNGVDITTNHAAPVSRAAAVTSMVFILFDVFASFFVFASKENRPDKAGIIAVASAAILSSLPLIVPDLAQGHDLMFHLTRIEGIKTGLATGISPVKMESLWLGGYGYASEIYYGDLFLYFPAILRLAGFTLTEAFKFYLLFINLATAAVSYLSFRKIFKSSFAPAVSTIAYSLASFRLVDVYVRSTAGEIAALIFLPVVAAGFISIIEKDPTKKLRNMAYDGLLLAAGMSGLIITHIITTEMVLIVLVILSLILIPKMIKRIPTVIVAVIETFLISCSFVIPFLDYSSKVTTRISVWMMTDSDRLIQKTGASIPSYFAFTSPFFGSGTGDGSQMRLTPGLILLLALLGAVFAMIFRLAKKRMVISFIASVILLFMASNIFPWDFLEKNLFFGKALVSIQFPWRLLGLAILFLTLIAGDLVLILEKDKSRAKTSWIVFIAVIAAQAALSGMTLYAYLNEGYFDVQYLDTASLNSSYLGDNEYLPTGFDPANIDHEAKGGNGVEIQKSNYTYDISPIAYTACVANTSSGSSFIDLPLINYPYYAAYSETGDPLEITSGDNGLIRVTVPAGYSGYIFLKFESPVLWKIADCVSVISVLDCAGFVLCVRKKPSLLSENTVEK